MNCQVVASGEVENGLSTQYPSSLVGLEDELSKFQNLASDIRRVGKSLEGSASSIYLSNIEDVTRAVRIQNKIPLFIMTPLTVKALNLNSEQLTPDLAIVRFLAMFHRYAAYFKDPSSPVYILYVEDLNSLELRLPNDGTFSGLKGPAIVIGQVDIEGKLTWSAPPLAIDLSWKLHHKPSFQDLGDLSFDVDIVDVTQAFSFHIRAKAPDTPSSGSRTICILQFAETKLPFLMFLTPLNVTLLRQDGTSALIDPPRSPTLQAGKLFAATIVQDIKGRQWILYLDKEPIATVLFRAYEVLQQAVKLQIAYPNIKWWGGEAYEVKAFSYALTKEQIAAEIQTWERRRNEL